MDNKKPGVGFGIIILNNKKKILLGKRHKNPEKTVFKESETWTCPGGKLEYKEDLENGLKREVAEETGIKINSMKLIAINNDINKYAHFVTIGFLCEDFEGEPQILEPNEITKWRWFNFNELPKKIYFPSQKLIKNYKQGKIYIPNIKNALD